MSESCSTTQDIWGDRTPFTDSKQWRNALNFRVTQEPDEWVHSACVLCSTAAASISGGQPRTAWTKRFAWLGSQSFPRPLDPSPHPASRKTSRGFVKDVSRLSARVATPSSAGFGQAQRECSDQ